MYTWKSYFVIQADYQHWANEVLFAALDHFQPDVIGSDQGLFFHSIHHTVDHMLVVSQSWLARLRNEPCSPNYKVINNPDWRELKIALRKEVRQLQDWLAAQPDEFFGNHCHFSGSDGKPREMWVRDVLAHMFTHYAHHRGQVSAAITRLGGPCPEMDFAYYRREMSKVLSEAQAQQAKDQ